MEYRNKILIVDDNSNNIRVLLEILKRNYQLNAATDGVKALDIAKKWDPDLILLDVVMPGINGYDICMQLRADEATKDIPVLFVTAVSDADEALSFIKAGALDYITKPINPDLLKAKMKNFVAIKSDRRILSKLIEGRNTSSDDSANMIMYATISLAEFRDISLGKNHVKRCVEYAKVMIKSMLSNKHFAELASSNLAEAICNAVPYHDIGKSILPDDIILKPDKLTPEEFEFMKTHVQVGGDIVESLSSAMDDEFYTNTALGLIRYHHERWDGAGYPEGLKGDKIPLGARIMAVADQYDALISRRIYKTASYHFEAVRIVSSESGKGFDPEIVMEFLKVQEDFLDIMQKYPDNERDMGFLMKDKEVQPHEL